MPAVERLALRRLLPAGFSVVGVARTEMDDDSFRDTMRATVEEFGGGGEDAKHVWEAFTGGFRYVAGDYGNPDTFDRLRAVLEELDEQRGTAQNRLYYLATPPDTFPTVVQGLARCGLNKACASRTPSSNPSGTGGTSTTYRSPWPSRSVSATAVGSTKMPGPSATSSRTT